MNFTQAPINDGLSEVALDARAHLMRVRGDASLVTREMRTAATDAVAEGRTILIVDMSAATNVGGPVAWELSRAHERLIWRAGRVIVVFDSSALGPLFDAFGLHRTPDVVPTIDAGLAAASVSEAGIAVAHDSAAEQAPAPPPGPPGNGAGVAEAQPTFAWRRHQDLPASWSFELPGGAEGPRIARAAVGRVLLGRMPESERRDAVLLVSETVMNSVMHGDAGDGSSRIGLTVTVSPERVRVEVSDPQGGFEPPAYPADELALSGRGLPIVHSLAQAWGVDPEPGGGVWFELPSGAAA